MNKTKLSQAYNELREVIIKACPEIMELKFGCKVLCKDYPDKECVRIYAGRRNHGESLQLCADNVEYLWRMDKKFEILGSPITIAEVLRFLNGNERAICVDWEGYFVELLDTDYNILSRDHMWNLEKNTLEWHRDNRAETIYFLHSLLKDEKIL